MLRAALIAAAVALPVTAQAQPVRDLAIERPAEGDWGPVALAVVTLRTGLAVPGKSYCPPLAPDEDEATTICLDASIIDHPGAVTRILAATPDFPRRLRDRRFRRIGGHALSRMSGGTYLALIEKTQDGYGWMAWTYKLTRDWACFDSGLIEKFSLKLPRRAWTNRDGERCIDL